MRGKKEKLNLEEPYFQSQTNVEEPIQRTKQGQSEWEKENQKRVAWQRPREECSWKGAMLSRGHLHGELLKCQASLVVGKRFERMKEVCCGEWDNRGTWEDDWAILRLLSISLKWNQQAGRWAHPVLRFCQIREINEIQRNGGNFQERNLNWGS